MCLFAYRALKRMPYDVYLGYHRVFMYIDDFIPTLANVADHFVPGEVYNIGGDEFRSVKELSDLILGTLRSDDSIVNYLPEDKHNVFNKKPNIEKAGEPSDITNSRSCPKSSRCSDIRLPSSTTTIHGGPNATVQVLSRRGRFIRRSIAPTIGPESVFTARQ